MSRPTRRSGPGGGRSETRFTADTQTPTTANNTARLAEDAVLQLQEAERWIDAADIALMAALDGRLDRNEATEHAIACNGRARRAVRLAVAA